MTLLCDFANGKSRAGSDGSFHVSLQKGAAAWRIESDCGTKFIEGGGIVPGPPEVQCAFRSEIGGLAGIYTITKELEDQVETHTHMITGCDSISALYPGMTPVVKAQWAHSDLVSDLISTHQKLDTCLVWTHVFGHQHKKFPGRKLTKMRCRMTAWIHWPTRF